MFLEGVAEEGGRGAEVKGLEDPGCARQRPWLGWCGWHELAWDWKVRCPWTVRLTGGLCGLRTAPWCEEMQRHLQQDDLGDPRGLTRPLPAKSRILRQACHHVGTGLWASANPRPHPSSSSGLLPRASANCSSCSWPPGPSLTLISVPQGKGWEQLPERPGAWGSY